MDPLTHALFAVIPLVGYSLVRHGRLPHGETVLLVVFATQLPDLIDKPLAWTFHVLPSGRMFAHSLVVALPCLAVVVVLAYRRGYGAYGVVFAAAYLSHLYGDFNRVLVLGAEYYYAPNMLWPLFEPNASPNQSFDGRFPDLAADTIGLGILVAVALCYAVFDVLRGR